MILEPGQQFSKYTAVRHLGQGGYGTVYEMHDNLMDRHCAVKFVPNKDPTQFKAHYEAQILHKCRHQRIVSVNSVDAFLAHGTPPYAIIDMEYCEHGSCDKLLQQEYITARSAMRALIDTLFALDHALRQGVLHRDVKPANIMSVGKYFKLADFGIAKAGMSGSQQGTPAYWAPEVLNKGETTVLSDIYAAGVTLFQLCNNYVNLGERIKDFSVISGGKVISSLGYERFVPRRLRAVCNKACSFDPSGRYQSPEEMRQALERLHIAEDWKRESEFHWSATIGGRRHEMWGENKLKIENVYSVDGRRKNSNCTMVPDLENLRDRQSEWVYNHTFA